MSPICNDAAELDTSVIAPLRAVYLRSVLSYSMTKPLLKVWIMKGEVGV